MLRCAFHTWLAARWRNMLSHVSHTPGGYGGVIVNVWMTNVRSFASAAAQIGSQSGSSSDVWGGTIGKMPTGHSSRLQRSISVTEPATSRHVTRITLVSRSGYGAQ